MAKRKVVKKKAVVEVETASEELQKKSLEFLILKATIARLEEKQKDVRQAITLMMEDESVSRFNIEFEGDVVGDIKPQRRRTIALSDRSKLSELISVRQLLGLVKIDSKTFDALVKLFKNDKDKLKILAKCITIGASDSVIISKKRSVESEMFAKAAMENAAKEADEAVEQMVEALKAGKEDETVSELLEELDKEEVAVCR